MCIRDRLHSYCYETARRALKWLKDPELIDFAEWLLWQMCIRDS